MNKKGGKGLGAQENKEGLRNRPVEFERHSDPSFQVKNNEGDVVNKKIKKE